MRVNWQGRKISVREMQEKDVEEVYEINRESFTTDAWSKDAFRREFKLPYSHRYVLEVENRVVAYIIYWIIRDEATVMSFAVSPTFRGSGIGKLLFRETLKLIEDKANSVVLDVRKSNLKAIRLYKGLGFTVVYEREKFYSDGENALFMKLSLDKIREDEGDKRQKAEPVN